jgi:MFS family permease
MLTTTPMPADPPPATGGWRRWGIVAAVLAAYVFSYADRQVLSLLVEPIRASLHLSDTQFGLMQGLSFSLFFVIASLPLARLADRGNRPRIIASCIGIWSLMTMACGFAGSFWQLLGARIGVAAAEAGLPPAALTLMADRFDRRMLARATSVVMLAPFLGGGLALAGGGALYALASEWTLPEIPGNGALLPWQAVFLMVGAPGLIVAGLLLLIRDPRKPGAPARGASANRALRDFFIGHWRFATVYTMATALLAMLLNAHIAWIPASLTRAHGLSPAAMGALFGPIYLGAGAAGTVMAGLIVARAAGDDMVARALTVMRAAAILLIPAAIAAPLVGPLWGKLALAGAAVYCTSAILSMASLPFQFAAPLGVRAQAIALQGLIASLVGTGLGPLIVGVLSDGFGFAERPLSLALAVLGAAVTPLILGLLHLVLIQHRRIRLDLRRQAA